MTQQKSSMVTPSNEWWLMLVEETLNRLPTDEELQIRFDAIDDEDRASLIGIVDEDAAATMRGGVGLWLAAQVLLNVAEKGFHTLTMGQMITITRVAEHLKETFWIMARQKYPDAEVLGLRSENARLVVINLKPKEKEEGGKKGLAKMLERAFLIKA
jgi:hypothetical protein